MGQTQRLRRARAVLSGGSGKNADVRAATPALRYGRQYFRPLSRQRDGVFGISTSAPGLVAFSRILNDTEVIVLANPFTTSTMSGSALVDFAR